MSISTTSATFSLNDKDISEDEREKAERARGILDWYFNFFLAATVSYHDAITYGWRVCP